MSTERAEGCLVKGLFGGRREGDWEGIGGRLVTGEPCLWVRIIGGRALGRGQQLICVSMHIHQEVMAELILLQSGTGRGRAVGRGEESRAVT